MWIILGEFLCDELADARPLQLLQHARHFLICFLLLVNDFREERLLIDSEDLRDMLDLLFVHFLVRTVEVFAHLLFELGDAHSL